MAQQTVVYTYDPNRLVTTWEGFDRDASLARYDEKLRSALSKALPHHVDVAIRRSAGVTQNLTFEGYGTGAEWEAATREAQMTATEVINRVAQDRNWLVRA